MMQIAVFEARISQYLQTILSSCHGWRLKLGQNSFAHPRTHFNRLIRIERKIYFGLIWKSPWNMNMNTIQSAISFLFCGPPWKQPHTDNRLHIQVFHWLSLSVARVSGKVDFFKAKLSGIRASQEYKVQQQWRIM